jgi:hypothetical protein
VLLLAAVFLLIVYSPISLQSSVFSLQFSVGWSRSATED